MAHCGIEPWLEAGVVGQVLDDHDLSAAQGPPHRAAPGRLVCGPAELDVVQIACAIAGMGHGAHRLRGIRLRKPHPGHAVAPHVDGNAADLVQQFAFVGGANQGFIAGAAHVQRAVEAGEFQFGFLAGGEVGHSADHADRPSAAVANHRAAIQHIGIAAVLMLEAVFGGPAFLA